MFNKLVAIEPINMLDYQKDELKKYAKEVILFTDIPSSDEEIIERIKDADCVLLSWTSRLTKEVISKCSNIKYIGMCCSLYSKESANVDIAYCENNNIVVKGIRDYGDNGVSEYVIHELVEFLGGYKTLRWDTLPCEITDLKSGVVGLGTSGKLIARTLKFFGADVSYYSRTRKKDAEDEGIYYKELHKLLSESEAIFLCLNKNVFLLQEEEFNLMSGKKILFNTSIGPGYDVNSLKKWLNDKDHYFFSDTLEASGDPTIFEMDNCFTINRSSGGKTKQAFKRLGEKVMKNMEDYLIKH